MTPSHPHDSPPEIFSEPLNVTVSLRAKWALREVAQRRGTSVASVVRDAIGSAIERNGVVTLKPRRP